MRRLHHPALIRGFTPGRYLAVSAPRIYRADMETLQAILATLLAGALLTGGVLLGRRVLARGSWSKPEPLQLPADPPPDGWSEIIQTQVPLTRRLDEDDFRRLLKLTQLFLQEKRMEGAGGLELTEEMAVTIAAQACLLVNWLGLAPYPELRTVIIYPDTMVRPRHADFVDPGLLYDDWDPDWSGDGPESLLGESWDHGVVLLSWNSARHGSWDRRDGVNVILHEFAHQLDQEAGQADGVPAGLPRGRLREWSEVLHARFEGLRDDARAGQETLLDPYGATNYAEFFAVATETFFEQPWQLEEEHPDLYRLLTGFYRVDPARGFRRVEAGTP